MTIIRHKNGVALPGPGFSPESLEKYRQPSHEEMRVLQTIPDKWQAAISVLRLAEIPAGGGNYAMLTRMAQRGQIERRLVAAGGRYHPQYRRKQE